MDPVKQKNFIIQFLFTMIWFLAFYLFFKYIIYYIMPFLIGFFIAFLLRPLFQCASRCTHLPKRLCAFIITLLFYMTIGSFLIYLSVQGFLFLKELLLQFPTLYTLKIEPFFNSWITSIQMHVLRTDSALFEAIHTMISAANSELSQIILSSSKHLMNTLAQSAGYLPSLITSIVFTIMSSFFFAMDYTLITSFLMRQMNTAHRTLLLNIKYYVLDSISSFICAYGKLMILTFFELMTGLFFLHIPNAVIISFLIALFDFFPILGTGGIMIPWIILQLIFGNIKTAVGLTILLLVITLIRNIIEPKVVGKEMGLHPIIMLLCMYLGARMFGILGMLCLPILIQVLQNLNDHGVIHLYHK